MLLPKPLATLKSAAALLIVAGLLAPSQRGVHAAGMLLRYHFVVGQQFSETETDFDTAIFKTNVASLNGTTQETDRYIANFRVTKVFPDGSSLLRITYSDIWITKNGTTTQYPTPSIVHQIRLSPTGIVIGRITTGSVAYGIVANDLPTGVTSPQFNEYPQAHIAKGGTWDQQAPIPGMGALVLHWRLQATGFMAGRPTINVGVAINQPFHATASGMNFDGRITGSGTAISFEDTGANVVPSRQQLTINAEVSGVVNGVTVHGTWTNTGATGILP